MNKVRKKYNPKKVVHAKYRLALKNKVIVYVTGQKYNELYCTKTKAVFKTGLEFAQFLCDVPMLWSITIAAFGRDQTGEEYMKTEVHHFQQKYAQSDLMHYLNEEHEKLINSMNRQHFIGVGWIASPEQKEFADKDAIKIFTDFGAFENQVCTT